MSDIEIIALKEEAYRRGFQDGFRQGRQNISSTPAFNGYMTLCRECGLDLNKTTHYVCGNSQCPSFPKVTC